MKAFFTRLAFALLYLWQLPQNLLGLVLVAVYGFGVPIDFVGDPRYRRLPSSLIFLNKKISGGISLGRYIIQNENSFQDIRSSRHERGHSIQSMILGPLYLLVVGLPSLLWAAWWNKDRDRDYYLFFTELWADRLGGVKR